MLLVKRIWLPSSRDSLGICCVARDESAGVRQRIEAARIVNERTRSRDCMLIHGLFSVREIADYRRAMRDRHHAVSEFERASIVLNLYLTESIHIWLLPSKEATGYQPSQLKFQIFNYIFTTLHTYIYSTWHPSEPNASQSFVFLLIVHSLSPPSHA